MVNGGATGNPTISFPTNFKCINAIKTLEHQGLLFFFFTSPINVFTYISVRYLYLYAASTINGTHKNVLLSYTTDLQAPDIFFTSNYKHGPTIINGNLIS